MAKTDPPDMGHVYRAGVLVVLSRDMATLSWICQVFAYIQLRMRNIIARIYNLPGIKYQCQCPAFLANLEIFCRYCTVPVCRQNIRYFICTAIWIGMQISFLRAS
jgi:hypothetical protein